MPDPNLQTIALRYAAGELPPEETATFEARLATDEAAQDALSEAVRLSARALGQEPPAPNRSFRRRPRRGFAAFGVGAAVFALATVRLAVPPDPPPTDPQPAESAASSEQAVVETRLPVVAVADEEHRTAAEIWAELSTPDHVEKAHEDELKRRQWMRDLRPPTAAMDDRVP